ncbi:ATP-binding protein [Candidatus Margulisiibacteriota bacterium]
MKIIFHALRPGMFFIAPAMLLFSYLLTKKRSKKIKYFILFSIVISAGISILNNTFLPSTLIVVENGFLPKVDLITIIHQINFIVIGGLGTVIITILNYRNSNYEERRRYKWVIAAFVIGAVFGVLSFNYSKLFGFAGNIMALSIIVYAITKHSLMDISLVISRAVARLLTNAFLIMLFIVFVFGYMKYFEYKIPVTFIIPTIIIGIAVGELYHKIRGFIQTPLEAKWVSDYYDSDKVFDNISEKLLEVLEFAEVISLIAEEIKKGLKLKGIKYYLLEKNSVIANAEAAEYFRDKNIIRYQEFPSELKEKLALKKEEKPLFFCLQASGKLRALFVLEQKISEAPFEEKDYKLLKRIGILINAVLERNKPYEEVKKNYKRSLEFAETASRQAAYGTMLNGIAHEIRNPLGMIRGHAEIIGDLITKPEKLKRSGNIIMEQIDRTEQIMEKMIHYGQTSEIPAQKSSIQVNDLIKEIKELSENELLKNNIELKTDLGDVPSVLADKINIHQVLINLVINAWQAMDKSGEIMISTKEAEFINKNNQNVSGIVIDIKDTGKGIEKSALKKIYEPFYTTKYSAGKNQHLGLGLSIALKIINAHNGIIEIESKENKGTNIKIFLPLS